MKKMGISAKMKAMIRAGKDINDVMGEELDPQIDIKLPEEELKTMLNTVGEHIETSDDLKEETWNTLLSIKAIKADVIPEKFKKAEKKVAEKKKVEKKTVEKKNNTKKTATKKKVTEKKGKKAVVKKTEKKKAVVKKVDTKTEKKSNFGNSMYSSTIEMMCKNPDMSKKQLVARMIKKYPESDNKTATITTAFSTVRRIVKSLRSNGKMD